MTVYTNSSGVLTSRSKENPQFFFKDYANQSYIVDIKYIECIIIHGLILNGYFV